MKTMVSNTRETEVWVQDYKMETLSHLNRQNIEVLRPRSIKNWSRGRPGNEASLDGEATECKLYKHSGCMQNTDYTSEKIDPQADQKQEINCVWHY